MSKGFCRWTRPCALALLLGTMLPTTARATVVSYAFSVAEVNFDLGLVYAPGTPVSGSFSYVTDAPLIQQPTPGTSIYVPTVAFPFQISLTIGSDTFSYSDTSQGTMTIQNAPGPGNDIFRMRAVDLATLTNHIELEFTDTQGTTLTSEAIPQSLAFLDFEQLQFRFSRDVGGLVGNAEGNISKFSFTPIDPPSQSVPEPGTAVLVATGVAGLWRRCRPRA